MLLLRVLCPDCTEWRTDSGGETVEVASASARVTPHLRARARRIQTQAAAAAHHQSSSMSLASDLLYGGGVGGGSLTPPPPTRNGGSYDTFATGTIQETDGASNGVTPCKIPIYLLDEPNITSNPNISSHQLRCTYHPIHVTPTSQ